MSFNQHHIDINRQNYEEYFLLYVDGELNPQQCDEVENFAAAHPDLREELDILLTARLDEADISFGDKDSLLAASMMNEVDESLLLYIDNELTETARAQCGQRLESDPQYAAQLQSLQQTCLDKKDTIVYPYKKELYRQSGKGFRLVPIFRAAASVVVLAGLGILWWTGSNQDVSSTPPTIALTPAQVEKNTTPERATVTLPAQPSDLVATTPVQQETKRNNAASNTYTNQQTKSTATQQNAIADVLVINTPDPRDRTIAYTETPAIEQNEQRTERITNDVRSQQIINNPGVTTTNPAAYINIDAAAQQSMVQHAVAATDDDKKSSVRGFLRKATRFIERRTGINPVNDDNELYVGAVAIKL